MPDRHRTLVAGVDSSTQSTKVVVCDADTRTPDMVRKSVRGQGRVLTS